MGKCKYIMDPWLSRWLDKKMEAKRTNKLKMIRNKTKRTRDRANT